MGRRPNTLASFWPKVDRSADPDACWPWMGGCDRDGYGVFLLDGKKRKAHRVALELADGRPMGADFALHRCDNPPCCNPAHLFRGTQADNLADMREKGRDRPNGYALRTRCPQGHEYTPENTRVYRGKRHCRMCNILKRRAERAAHSV